MSGHLTEHQYWSKRGHQHGHLRGHHRGAPAPGVYVDATFGRGGHTRGILGALHAAGCLHAFDMDPLAVEAGRTLAARLPPPPPYVRSMSALCPLYVRSVSALCPSYVRHMSAIHPLPVCFRKPSPSLRYVSAPCPPYVRSMSALYPLCGRSMSALCPLYVRSMSALCPLYVRSVSALMLLPFAAAAAGSAPRVAFSCAALRGVASGKYCSQPRGGVI